ncbi:MAG: hypothetical protein WCO09_02400 [bacterium]
MIKKSLILFFALICIFFAFGVHAQIKSEDISLNISPAQPKANEKVSASLSSYMLDLNKALISWNLNGQPATQGVGQKNFSFNSGSNGSQTIISVTINTVDGLSINKQFTINPASIDVLWEAYDSYVPPFYKGKALLSSESTAKIVALLSSSKNSGVSYNWKLDGSSQLDSSGYGKSFYLFKKTYLDKNNTVEVIASNLMGQSLGSGKIGLSNGNPKILFYKKDQNLGTQWQQTLEDGFNVDKNGETIVVEPYFMSPKNLNSSDFSLNWELAGTQINTPAVKNELSIKPDSKGGSSAIKVTVENIKSMFLNANKTINVSF